MYIYYTRMFLIVPLSHIDMKEPDMSDLQFLKHVIIGITHGVEQREMLQLHFVGWLPKQVGGNEVKALPSKRGKFKHRFVLWNEPLSRGHKYETNHSHGATKGNITLVAERQTRYVLSLKYDLVLKSVQIWRVNLWIERDDSCV